jgi:hypothetical protein
MRGTGEDERDTNWKGGNTTEGDQTMRAVYV